MGNASDKAPESYSTKEVHEGDFLSAYKGGGTGELVSLGPGNPKMSLGAKIIQSVAPSLDENGKMQPSGEFFVMSKGKRVYVSENGAFNDKSADLLGRADNYSLGPTLMVSGPVGNSKITVFGSTSTTESNDWQPLQINNEADFRKALWVGHPGAKDVHGKYVNRYGDLSVNPFLNRPRNGFSDLADFGRGVEKVVDVVAIPMIELAVDEFTDGLGSALMELTGASDFLQGELDQLTESHGLDYDATGNTTDPALSNVINDPRLSAYYDKLMDVSRRKSGKYNKNDYAPELSKISNGVHQTAEDKMMAVHKLEDLNLQFDSSQQMEMLNKTVALLKKMVPNPPDFDWETVTAGIGAAQTPAQQIRVSKFLTSQLKTKVMPFVKKRDMSPPDPKDSVPQANKKDKKTASDPSEKPTAGLINGAKKQEQHPDEIKPFYQPSGTDSVWVHAR